MTRAPGRSAPRQIQAGGVYVFLPESGVPDTLAKRGRGAIQRARTVRN